MGAGTPDRGAGRDAGPGRGAAPRPLRDRRQPLAGDAGRPAGALRASRGAGRVPHPRRATELPRPAAGPAAGRCRHAPALRALRPDDDGAAGRPAALGGRRPVRRGRGAAPGPRPRPRPATDRPAPAPGAGRGERRPSSRRSTGSAPWASPCVASPPSLCDRLRERHLAPGRAVLDLRLEDAPDLRVAQPFPQPALEPDWIARLLLSRVEAAARGSHAGPGCRTSEEPRVASVHLAFDRWPIPAEPAAARLRGARRTLGGAALVAGADPASVRGGPPLAGEPASGRPRRCRSIGRGWWTSAR